MSHVPHCARSAGAAQARTSSWTACRSSRRPAGWPQGSSCHGWLLCSACNIGMDCWRFYRSTCNGSLFCLLQIIINLSSLKNNRVLSKPIYTYRNAFSYDTTTTVGDDRHEDSMDNAFAVPTPLSRVRAAREFATAISSRSLCCRLDRCNVRGPTKSYDWKLNLMK